MMKFKKALSLLLVSVLLLSVIPAAATDGLTNSTASSTTGEGVIGDENPVDVLVTKGSTYTITVPKIVILAGDSGIGNYSVKVEGDLSGTEIISVVPYSNDDLNLLEENNSFKLSQAGKTDITAIVTQDKTEWSYNNLGDGNGTITATNLSAGSWSGNFRFYINRTESFYPVRLIEGDGQTVNKFAFNEVRFRSSAPVDEFTEVKINGEVVDPENYIVSEGSTIIVFKNEYVESLEIKSNQTIEIVSDSGIADGDFHVVNLIPEGGKYVTANGEEYGAGDNFPSDINVRDSYTYGDYEYRYGYTWCAKQDHESWSDICGCNFAVDHWAVHVIKMDKTSYGPILTQINGDYISDLTQTFAGCTELVSAPNIPNGIEIMKGTFVKCSSLIVAPQIPNTVTNIVGTFEECTSLKKAPAIPSHITDMSWTFNHCTSLEKAPVLPPNVNNLQDTFAYCTSLKEAPYIPSSAMMMVRTFKGCTSLTKTPEFGEGVKYLMWTFQDCSSLTDITLPVSVINLQETFRGCSSLKTLPQIPSSVFSMSFTFAECTSLKDLGNTMLPNTGLYGVFANCTSLVTAPVIPSGATNVSRLFEGCTALSGNITINTNTSTYSDCFKNVDFSTQNITLLGDSTILDTIGATGLNYCANCNGVCVE